MCRGFESHPSSSFFFSEKKELFGLVAFPFFLFIEKSFHVCKKRYVLLLKHKIVLYIAVANYKNGNSYKGLIGISPNGVITFISTLHSVRRTEAKSTQTNCVMTRVIILPRVIRFPVLEQQDSLSFFLPHEDCVHSIKKQKSRYF